MFVFVDFPGTHALWAELNLKCSFCCPSPPNTHARETLIVGGGEGL